MAEREDVARALVAGHSIRSIATTLGRALSTISREIRRNGDAVRYRASHADQAAWNRAHRPKACKLALHPTLAKRVADRLQQQWSLQQIAGWLMHTYPNDATCQVFHDTIYRTLSIQLRGALQNELLNHLRGRGPCACRAITPKDDRPRPHQRHDIDPRASLKKVRSRPLGGRPLVR